MCYSPWNMSEGVDLIDIYADEEFNQVWSLGRGCKQRGSGQKKSGFGGTRVGLGSAPWVGEFPWDSSHCKEWALEV